HGGVACRFPDANALAAPASPTPCHAHCAVAPARWSPHHEAWSRGAHACRNSSFLGGALLVDGRLILGLLARRHQQLVAQLTVDLVGGLRVVPEILAHVFLALTDTGAIVAVPGSG